jgi:methyl-accepting chemotaxis protein
MGLGTKIFGMAAFLMLLMVAVATFGIVKMNNIGNEITAVAEEDIPLTMKITEVTEHQLEMGILFERGLRHGEKGDLQGLGHLEEEFLAVGEHIGELIVVAEEIAEEAMALADSAEQRQEFADINKHLQVILKEHDDVEHHGLQTFEALHAGDLHKAEELAVKVEQEEDQLIKELEAFVAQIEEFTMQATLRAEHDEQSAVKGLVVLSLLGVVVGLLAAFYITRSITKPLQNTVDMIEELEKGHLDKRLNIDRGDEIGRMAKTMDSFADSLQNEMVDALQKLAANDLTFDVSPRDEHDKIRGALKKAGDDLNNIVSQINVSGEQVASASNQVSSASQSLSQGSTEQASSIEEITSSMTEMGAQTNTNSENANQANQLADQASNAADRGNQQMQEMVAAMGEINEAGQNISKIIKVIDEIAFQTNLLALNAAVEAARAGKHGKGFAVVAEEVRNLAARSAQAARETAELIEGSVAKTENGSNIASQTAEALNEIVGGITKVSDLVAEINAASSEQAQGIAQINEGLGQIDQVTQQNTANAEESAAAAEELSGQATQLKGMLARFQLKNQQSPQHAQPVALAYNKMDDAWGGAPPQEDKAPAKPSDIIALDDGDFGKY